MILILTLLSLFSGGSQEHSIYCADMNGFLIVNGGVSFLEADRFNEAFLSEYFSQLEVPDEGEYQKYVSADPRLLEEPSISIPSPDEPRQWWFDSGRNFAGFFRFGENGFYFLCADGRTRWITLTGRNLFKTSPFGDDLHFAGTNLFGSDLGPSDCRYGRRLLAFVYRGLPDLDVARQLQVLSYFDKTFSRPGNLTVEIFDSFEHLYVHDDVLVFPSPDLTNQTRTGMPVISAFLFRHQSRGRIVSLWSDGKIVYYDDRFQSR